MHKSLSKSSESDENLIYLGLLKMGFVFADHSTVIPSSSLNKTDCNRFGDGGDLLGSVCLGVWKYLQPAIHTTRP